MLERAGLTRTGREIRDPSATLYELEDAEQNRFTSIVFDERFRGHPTLTLDVELVLGFLEVPLVTGLVELAAHDLATASFTYATGEVWTLWEILRRYRDLGQPIGARAALELVWLGGQVLQEASENGAIHGCFSHGNVCPSRIALRPNGELQILGHGLAHVDVLMYVADRDQPVQAESLRYAPPERLRGQPEDIAADLWSLTTVAYEIAKGDPQFDALEVDAVHRAILSGKPKRWPKSVPAAAGRALTACAAQDPDDRPTALELVAAVGAALESADGDGLGDIVGRLLGARKSGKRTRKLVSTDETSAHTPEDIREATEEVAADEAEERWKAVEREKAGTQAAPEPAPAEPEPAPRRRRRRSSEDEAAAPKPRRRRRRETARSEEAEAEEPAPRRRRRRRADGAKTTTGARRKPRKPKADPPEDDPTDEAPKPKA